MTGFGLPRHHFRVTDSTNERARELALAGAPSGTVVTADEQTSGVGAAWAAGGRPLRGPASSARSNFGRPPIQRAFRS